ncbi:hypothetical protein [Roseofilum casamattae]|uniref:O-linked N-acetylglucosamine transferase, SPINDLY family protein n=1 Tax=Roseofilum casamattae BLCC-M143 TaxID=3022442 RepID=A0ABT7BSM1_9CYAN|nr:hypothetical protein [Roseofilum casamattae]MDJ1182184.1 O-linked N-acetylglucosamine transferase, SPINDLY family protein [Roseofilum casamattae BLCC-M143]
MVNLSAPSLAQLQQQAWQCLVKADYSQAITLYQKIVEVEPEQRHTYWNLGLALLLDGQEMEAQVTWMLVIGEGTEAEVEEWTAELLGILTTEADRQEAIDNLQSAWVIRQHIREIVPTDSNNLLKLLQLGLKSELLTEEEIDDIGIISLLESELKVTEIDFSLLMQTLAVFLDKAPLDPVLPKLVEASVGHIPDDKAEEFINLVLSVCLKINHNFHRPDIAVALTKITLKADPEHLEAWRHLCAYYQNVPDHDLAVEAAQKAYSLSETLIDQIIGNYLYLRALMGAGGYWQESVTASEQQAELLLSLDGDYLCSPDSSLSISTRLYTTSFFFPYFVDNAAKNRHIHNHLAQCCQRGIEYYNPEKVQHYRSNWNLPSQKSKRLRIGYLSHCFSSHSVGWLARWLFQYHDREKYDIYAYVVNYRSVFKDPVQEWYIDNVTEARKLGMNASEIADCISEDQVDILVDMDSITLDLACAIMSMKPAPIQVSWLGWDAPGIANIDYMIADPYVLPDNADDYYQEKIWRLPQTYIAVDGFEVAVPTLRREMLELPSNAVVYFSSQRGYKRHPDTARLQLQIIKQVPNSYFLIKGFGDQESIKRFFLQLAEEEGVSQEQLRFLAPAPSESMHRANMGIADVVLDTYPYNGATTTLETLWMCIPMVTRVGEQFAARNSYTMMINAGIEEGIAWNNKEYVEWGVRLGKEPALRQDISWRLKQSRQKAPLWDTKAYARQMEEAYEQMWQKYVESAVNY